MKYLLTTMLAVTGGVILIYSLKKCKIRYSILSVLTGIAALFAADVISGFFDFNIPINAFTLGVSAVGGIPGVILLNIMSILFL